MADEKFEAFKLIKKGEFSAENFQKIEPEAGKVINDAKPDDLLVLTITNNSPTFTVKKAAPFTEEEFDKILSEE